MGTNFELGTQRYLGALREGAEIGSAIGEAHVAIHKDAVFAAAVEMLAETGVIDMKQLAVRAGISRASLYRYYADKLAVEAEVAGCLARRMAEAAASHERVLDKLRVVIDVMIEFPAGAASLAPVVAEADPDVIAESCRSIVGHPGATPVLVGFAAMIASAHRRGAMDQVKVMADDILNQFELSLA
ncbi:MAG: TetR family transcriptional regulator [Actinomycetota bacterium]